ncbi:hypothetical protein HS1genome_1114 [Sulfodiicoccus acidiphilus]|uniref:Chromatin protein Cren7 n=1 Tax=Sulfodiicoccus acidiphilus TaxID=1670455 RepID=A0A348B3H3_9CREN|nr:chromatin protein Cren7 [Sulfodiicoccus acidiphilus]BBD72725.1 hypothetical protein HS1genome_1114 [Sulfodiicoccus acidiphilus]GGT95272.1 hypothetical protein GCM10007116_10930 [Sulfodiicoccus acidiphilus]
MPKKRKEAQDVCPACGNKVDKPTKTWQLVSPLPDAQGRITITVMGVYECDKCGNRWKGVVSKIKAGGSGVEVEGKKGKKRIETGEQEKDEGYVIELDLGDEGGEDEEE